jgi:hypothetical protein
LIFEEDPVEGYASARSCREIDSQEGWRRGLRASGEGSMDSKSRPAWSSWLLVFGLAPPASLLLGDVFGTPPSWAALKVVLLAQCFLVVAGTLALLIVKAAEGRPEQSRRTLLADLQASRGPLSIEVSTDRTRWESQIQQRLQRMYDEAASLQSLETLEPSAGGDAAEAVESLIAGNPRRRAPGEAHRRAA